MENLLKLILICILSSFEISLMHGQRRCPGYLLEDGSACYWVTSTFGSVEIANNECNSNGGMLAVIPNKSVNDELRRNADDIFDDVGRTKLWLGINDSVTEGVFQTVTGQNVTWTNWDSSEPNDPNSLFVPPQDFVVVNTADWEWYDVGSGNRYRGLCYRSHELVGTTKKTKITKFIVLPTTGTEKTSTSTVLYSNLVTTAYDSDPRENGNITTEYVTSVGNQSKVKSHTGAIVGAIFGGLIVVGAVIFLFVFLLIRRKPNKSADVAKDEVEVKPTEYYNVLAVSNGAAIDNSDQTFYERIQGRNEQSNEYQDLNLEYQDLREDYQTLQKQQEKPSVVQLNKGADTEMYEDLKRGGKETEDYEGLTNVNKEHIRPENNTNNGLYEDLKQNPTQPDEYQDIIDTSNKNIEEDGAVYENPTLSGRI